MNDNKPKYILIRNSWTTLKSQEPHFVEFKHKKGKHNSKADRISSKNISVFNHWEGHLIKNGLLKITEIQSQQ